jgi:predicted HNH restriction endonuclease
MKDPITPRSQIVHSIRQLWLRSRERGECLKLAKYTCTSCGKKQSKKKGFEQKVEVHHKEGIENWDEVVECIRKNVLCDPTKLECLCPECHGSV